MSHPTTSTPTPRTPTGATTPDDAPVPDGVPDAPTARALWVALLTRADVTATDLASAAIIGRSTASKILAVLERAGLASRTPGAQQGRTRLPDRWNATPPGSVAPAVPEEHRPPTGVDCPTGADADCPTGRGGGELTAATGGAGAPTVGQPPGGALQRGQLRDLVAAHLREHPDQDHAPTAIARALKRSAGAVANACVSLTARGLATQTSPHPRRYQATALLREMT